MLADKHGKKLVDMTCKNFAEETASESPAPGEEAYLHIWAL